MMFIGPLSARIARFAVGRHRHLLIAGSITLLVSVVLLALIGLTRWGGERALRSDTAVVVEQAKDQLVRALNSRRATLTFIRDTLNRRSDLTQPQLKAMGASATEHTRHLLGTGLIRASSQPVWWFDPQDVSALGLKSLNRAIVARSGLRGVWRVPSTFVTTTTNGRSLLVMFEPLRAAAYKRSAITGVFDLEPLLEDFFASRLAPRYPAQIIEGDATIFRSNDWRIATEENQPIVVEYPMAMDALRWKIQIQPGATRVVRTLSWFHVLLIGLSIVAGLGIILIVWILAARSWILQRAVQRRTAALRRTSARLRQLAITDDLTGLHNRRFFLDRWQWECDRAKRYHRPLACLMVDVDGFKQVNDRLGHQAGDSVLKQVAGELKAALRQSDILARFGGDEFIIALPETTPKQAESVAEKLRQVSIEVADGERRRTPAVRLSVGISRIRQEADSPQSVIQRADASLYAFKHRTKNNG